MGFDAGAGGGEEAGKSSAGNAPKKRVDEPGDDGGNGTAEGDGFQLRIDAAIFFLKAPAVAEAPKVAMRVGWRQLAFAGLAGVLELSDAGGVRTDEGAAYSEAFVVDVEVGVECDGDERLFVELEKHLGVAVALAEQAGGSHVGVVDLPVTVVVAEEREGFGERGVRDEEDANPVVNESVRDFDGVSFFGGADLPDENFSAA